MPGMIPPVAVVVVVVAATCRGAAVVVRMTIRTQTRFSNPGQTQGYV